MDLEVLPGKRLAGVVKAPPSKSYTHRAIILAGLGHGTTKVLEPLLSEDPLATIDAMRAAGASIDVYDDHLLVRGNAGNIEGPELVDVKNSGTTIRIMSSVFSLQSKKVTLTGDESIQRRPMGPLLEALEGVGVKTSSNKGNPPISVQGPMQGRVIRIRGDVSSQYISGLLIACPLRKHDTTIEITTDLKSQPYIDVTIDALSDFGVKVEAGDDYREFRVPGNQFYSRNEYTVEGDYSGAAFMLGASAITEDEVTVRNLFQQSKQGDRYFLDILKMMDANVKIRGDEVSVSGGRSLRGVDVDLSQTPDLLPITAVMCALARGRSRIYNVEHARIKECDRISAMAAGLKRMGAKVEEKQDGFIIEGVDGLQGAPIESFADHRIVMAFAVAVLRAEGKTTINKAESVAVSYPKFIEDFKRLGAGVSTV
jgi:3-phosphoshikimate 1-carboxyvinyltransferase